MTRTGMTRRAILATTPLLAMPAFPALASPHPDAGILAAWERRCGAYRVLEMVAGKNSPLEPEDPRETVAWEIVDEAEIVIQRSAASTPEGIAIQVWTALYHQLDTGWHDEVVANRDLTALRSNEDLDWGPKLMVAALTSLSTMEARRG